MRRRLEGCADAWERGEHDKLDAYPSPFARRALPSALGWYTAAVLAVLALIGWWPVLTAPVATAEHHLAAAPLTVTLAREQLLHSSAQVGRWSWQGGTTGVTGDVVWDNGRQQGYLLLEGLPANAGSPHQYQLWIFDAARDDRYPVDGGVFDVDGDSVAVVPIHAALHITRPTAFAVTLEQSGGVVVSDRQRIVALARADPH